MGKTVKIKGKEVFVPLETGDIVTHPQWAPGETRVVCGVYHTQLPPQLDTGKPEFDAELDRPVIDPDDPWLTSPKCSDAERDLARWWMVAGLVKVGRAPSPEMAERFDWQLTWIPDDAPTCFKRGLCKETLERDADYIRASGAQAYVTDLRTYFEKVGEQA